MPVRVCVGPGIFMQEEMTNLVFAVSLVLSMPADRQQADASDQDDAGRKGGDGVAGDAGAARLLCLVGRGPTRERSGRCYRRGQHVDNRVSKVVAPD